MKNFKSGFGHYRPSQCEITPDESSDRPKIAHNIQKPQTTETDPNWLTCETDRCISGYSGIPGKNKLGSTWSRWQSTFSEGCGCDPQLVEPTTTFIGAGGVILPGSWKLHLPVTIINKVDTVDGRIIKAIVTTEALSF